jgi:hypothetical protein
MTYACLFPCPRDLCSTYVLCATDIWSLDALPSRCSLLSVIRLFRCSVNVDASPSFSYSSLAWMRACGQIELVLFMRFFAVVLLRNLLQSRIYSSPLQAAAGL